MATTEKVSVAIGREELRLARRAARAAGISLSAFITSAVRSRVDEQRRLEAARQVLATFDPEDFPTPEQEAELLALWSRPRAVPKRRRKSA
jgi:hypothetical protein